MQIDNLSLLQWLSRNGFQWALPSRNETLKDSCKNTLLILALLPILTILFCVRLLHMLFSAILDLFKSNKKDVALYGTLTLISVLVALFLAGMTLFFRVKVMENNENLRYERMSIFVHNINIRNDFPDDELLQTTYEAILSSLQRDYTGKEVIRIKKRLEMDEGFVANIHLKHQDDFVLLLYTLKDQDNEFQDLIDETDYFKGLDKLENEYRIAAVSQYLLGNYYSATKLTEHYFKHYLQHNEFATTSAHNNMHLLRLLSNYQWELTVNRDFAQLLNNIIKWNSREELNINQLEQASQGNKRLQDLVNYFSALVSFYDSDYIVAMNLFEKCASQTDDDMLKQYCALMNIRAAFWEYNRHYFDGDQNKYSKLFHETLKTNQPKISLPYFISDLSYYNSLVE